MPLTYPLALSEFSDGLQVVDCQVFLPDLLAASKDGIGNVYMDDLGDRLWIGQISQHRRLHAEARRIDARLSALREAGASFLICDPSALGPAYDPSGAILGGAVPVINSLAANSRELTIASLPANYVITQGDRIAWTYVVGSVTKYAYHKVVTGRTANGSGTTGQIEVSPPIRAGVTVSTPVTLIKPAFEAVYDPGTYQAPTARGVQSEGLMFGFQQTLKG